MYVINFLRHFPHPVRGAPLSSFYHIPRVNMVIIAYQVTLSRQSLISYTLEFGPSPAVMPALLGSLSVGSTCAPCLMF